MPLRSTLTEDSHTAGLGLGGLTFLQLATTYASVIAGRNIGHVFLETNKRYAWTERFSTDPGISRQVRVPLGLSAHSFGGSSETLVYD